MYRDPWFLTQELVTLYARNLHDELFVIDRTLFEKVLDDLLEARMRPEYQYKICQLKEVPDGV